MGFGKNCIRHKTIGANSGKSNLSSSKKHRFRLASFAFNLAPMPLTSFGKPRVARSPFPVIAPHDYTPNGASECSMGAIKAACRQGLAAMALNMQKIADGAFICAKGEELDRMRAMPAQTASCALAEMTNALLQSGDGDDVSLKPTLDAALPLTVALSDAQGKMLIVVVIRHGRANESRISLVKQACDIIKNSSAPTQAIVKLEVVSLGEVDALKNIWEARGGRIMPVVNFTAGSRERMINAIVDLNPEAVEIKRDSREALEFCCSKLNMAGARVLISTVDEMASVDLTDAKALEMPSDAWAYLVGIDVGFAQTQRPVALANYLLNCSELA